MYRIQCQWQSLQRCSSQLRTRCEYGWVYLSLELMQVGHVLYLQFTSMAPVQSLVYVNVNV